MESIVDLAPDVTVGGRYRLIEPLAQGGTASVWRAVDERLERQVALKVLRDEGIDPQLRSRAEREAKVLASLKHRNLVQVYDSGVDRGRPFFVMELLRGSSLHQILGERGRLEVDEAVRLVADVADGLGVAHAAGVIHRDVKPANIMCHDDVPTLVDFGIARRTDATTMTRGLVLGTASYLSPEQAQDLAITPASDVYALGCVLFELLTGTPPFTGDNPVAVASKHVSEAPPAPSSVEASVPPAVDAVVLRCLSKDPTTRPADGAALAAELRRSLTPEADATIAVAPVVVAGPATEVMPAVEATTVAADVPAAPTAAPVAVANAGLPWRPIAAVVVAALVLLLVLRAVGGDDGTTVPEVIGLSSADALAELDDAGLRADVFEVDSDQPAGTVVMTGPGPGLEAEPGSEVKVAVSNGAGAPAAPTTTTPPPPSDEDDDEGDGGRGEGRGKGKKDDD